MPAPTYEPYPQTLTGPMIDLLHDQVNQLARVDPQIVVAVAVMVDLIASNTLPHQSTPKGGA